jgi:hypothetical protein
VTIPVTTVVIPPSTITIIQTVANTVNGTSAPANANSSNITVTTLPSTQLTTIQSVKLVILQNTTSELEFGFNYFDDNGNPVHFQNAALTVNIGISGTGINAGTQQSVSLNILTAGLDTEVSPGARTVIKAPTIVTSEDTITIPRNILNLQGVINNNVEIITGLSGTSNPSLEPGAGIMIFAQAQLAQ